MRKENKSMKEYLRSKGINAQPCYLWSGSMKGLWRLYDLKTKWYDNIGLQSKLTMLGFKDFDGDVLDNFSGNGGAFQIFAQAPKELTLQCVA